MTNLIQNYNAETKRLFEEKFPTIRCVTPPHAFTSDRMTAKQEDVLAFFTSRQEGLLEVVKEMLEDKKAFENYPDTEDGRKCGHENRLFNSALSQAQEILKTKE